MASCSPPHGKSPFEQHLLLKGASLVPEPCEKFESVKIDLQLKHKDYKCRTNTNQSLVHPMYGHNVYVKVFLKRHFERK